MSGRTVIPVIAIAAVSVVGGLYLMNTQFANGDIYPEFSSMRSDPAGAKLLADSLALVPGFRVTRNYLPLEYANDGDSAVLLLDLKPAALSEGFLKGVDRVAARGNRVILAVSDPRYTPQKSEPIAKDWKVRFACRDGASDDCEIYFAEATGWKAMDRVAAGIERASGKGSVVLLAGCEGFSNGALAGGLAGGLASATAGFAEISAALGPYSRVVFDEHHLGIEQTGSVVGLVRRFRLTGMALGLGFCAALLFWRNASAFPPRIDSRPAGPDTGGAAGRTSRSGLVTLLRRHVPAAELASVCWNEWLAVNKRAVSAEAAARAGELARNSAGDPVSALVEMQSVVNSKGKTL